MQKYILIRNYREQDKLSCKRLLEASVMSQLNHTFFGFILALNIIRMVFVLSILVVGLLVYAELHIIYCIIVMCIPGIILYISLYTKFRYDARMIGYEIFDISRIYTLNNSARFWIAELYEDFSLNNQEQNQQYTFMTEEEMRASEIDLSKYNKKIIGILLFCQSNWQPTHAWIKRFYVLKKYTRKGVGSTLLKHALQFAGEKGFVCVKATISQFQKRYMYFYYVKTNDVTILRDRLSFFVSITLYEYIFRTKNYQ
ncbi:uncharacterized protein LOC118443803 [Vespa mandarinia]|uniref:uncharacterized protein LOC118443803 n=1 Tax=Vespa mandarinia TaxID=7446 RepID=UPI001621B988|nr:uncharacterized protein LOC118443803 [Vespa mandarinia]